jgi:hypothetical protein
MGCMLVKTSVYGDLVKPWHHFRYDEQADDHSGEDVWFCRLARAKGYEILIDHDLSKKVQHLGEFAYKHEHAVAHSEMARTQAEAQRFADMMQDAEVPA